MKKSKEFRSIVIIQTAFLGDVILSTPLIRAVQELFPLADVDVVVIPETAAVLKNSPYIRKVYTFDKRADKTSAFFRMIRLLRDNHYDLGITPHKSMTTAQLLYWGKVKQRVGFAGNAASLLYTDRVPFDVSKPQIQRCLDLLTVFTKRRFSAQSELYFDAGIKEKAAQLLKSYANYPLKIALAPGSIWPTKRWPTEKFIELVKRLKRWPLLFVFIGSAEERALCQKIISNSGVEKTVNLAGTLNVLESAAVIAACDVLICNDSGAMHLANAVKTDVLAFFGPTVQRYGFAPFREDDQIFEVDLDCRPCSLHGGEKCPKGHFRCMREIKVEAVLRAVKERLSLDS
jgi:heptosyltransferase II